MYALRYAIAASRTVAWTPHDVNLPPVWSWARYGFSLDPFLPTSFTPRWPVALFELRYSIASVMSASSSGSTSGGGSFRRALGRWSLGFGGGGLGFRIGAAHLRCTQHSLRLFGPPNCLLSAHGAHWPHRKPLGLRHGPHAPQRVSLNRRCLGGLVGGDVSSARGRFFAPPHAAAGSIGGGTSSSASSSSVAASATSGPPPRSRILSSVSSSDRSDMVTNAEALRWPLSSLILKSSSIITLIVSARPRVIKCFL